MKPYYTELENGTIMIEWVASDVRFCINIEVDPSESNWCFVTKDGAGSDSGYLPPEFVRLLTQRALDGATVPNADVIRQSREQVGDGGPAKSPRR